GLLLLPCLLFQALVQCPFQLLPQLLWFRFPGAQLLLQLIEAGFHVHQVLLLVLPEVPESVTGAGEQGTENKKGQPESGAAFAGGLLLSGLPLGSWAGGWLGVFRRDAGVAVRVLSHGCRFLSVQFQGWPAFKAASILVSVAFPAVMTRV